MKKLQIKRGFPVALIIALTLISAWKVALDMQIFSSPEVSGGLAARLLFFDGFLAEGLALAGLSSLLLCSLKGARYVFYATTAIYCTIYGVELFSMHFGREFLNPLALENMIHIVLLLSPGKIIVISAFLATAVFSIYLVERFCEFARPEKPLFTVIPISFLLITGIYPLAIPAKIIEQRNTISEAFQMSQRSPILHFFKLLKSVHPKNIAFPDSPAEKTELSVLGISFNKENRFPFLKPAIHNATLPFPGPGMPDDKPNVIVFFTEGMSARSMDVYGSKIQGLTPNLKVFAEKGMRIDGYYNHTAATDRAIRGQLCSFFPYYATGRNEINYYCLPEMLRRNGYNTTFLNANGISNAPLHDVAVKLNFEKVISSEEALKKYNNGSAPGFDGRLDDSQFFHSLIELLKEKQTNNTKPFFLALYNVQTHFGVDVRNSGVKYGDGSNNALNTIHNFDNAFGEFWSFFEKSALAKNTVIFFTADHCHYYENSFVRAFGGDTYQHIFVDQIPFIIYDQRRTLPQTFNATVTSSIDFAPTVAHYLGMPNEPTAFRGTSIFERTGSSKKIAAAGYGLKAYLIEPGVIRSASNPGIYRNEISILFNHLQYGYFLERSNRIFPPPNDRIALDRKNKSDQPF